MISREKSLGVLAICPQFRPIIGGYERAAERLSAALAGLGVHVVVITERRNRSWPRIEYVQGYEIRRLFCSYRRHRHAITSLISFALYLVRHGGKFDVWHVHQYGLHAALAVVLGKLLRRPVILKLPSSGAMGIGKTVGVGVVGRAQRFLHLRVGACVVVSDETHNEAIRFGIPSERIHLISNGVDGRRFCPALPEERAATRRALGIACERLVLYVGRLSPEKNTIGLMDAWAAIDPSARANTLLVIVGDGPEYDEVSAQSRKPNVAGSVHLAGHRSDVESWYRAADIYVIPSLLEGLSNTMIEALASGLPVVSTRVSGSAILLAPLVSGVVVDVADVKQLATAIETLLKDKPERDRLGENARVTFEEHFSIESSSKKMISLYRDFVCPERRMA